jgi:hypothetical protein
MCFNFLYDFYLKLFFIQEEIGKILSLMYIGLYVKCLIFVYNCNQIWFFSKEFSRSS